jgi:hypothetical protein
MSSRFSPVSAEIARRLRSSTHAIAPLRRGDERGRAPRARAETAERKHAQIGLLVRPVRRVHQPPAEQRDVEAVLARLDVALFLDPGEEIEKQRRDSRMLQLRGDPDVARAVPAAAAAVREQHDPFRARRNGEVAGERCLLRGNRDFARDLACNLLLHEDTSLPWAFDAHAAISVPRQRRGDIAMRGACKALSVAREASLRSCGDVILTMNALRNS